VESQRRIPLTILSLFLFVPQVFYISKFSLKLPKLPHSKSGAIKEVKGIIHPDKLKLRRISVDEDVIKRCGMQLFQIYDKDDPDKMVSGHDHQKFYLLIF